MTNEKETKDILIYGAGKIGEAIKTMGIRAKEKSLYYNSDIYTIDKDEAKGQFSNISEIKDLPRSVIHVIAIDTGVLINESGFEPDTVRIQNLIEEIIEERGHDNPKMDTIVIESTIEIGFMKRLKESLDDIIKWEIVYSPERYLEDTTKPDGFTLDASKIVGVDVSESKEDLDFTYNIIKDSISCYLDIFTVNDIKIIMCPMAEAEASKVVENALRYMNISFVNELNYNFNGSIDIPLLMDLIATKENNDSFKNLRPGLIGGGCIPIDPLFLPNIGNSIISNVVSKERERLNTLVNNVLKIIINSDSMRIALMGIAYKKNSTSTKNSVYKAAVELIGKGLMENDKTLEENPNRKLFVIDHLVEEISTPKDYIETKLDALDLILVGANHTLNDSNYLEIALKSGTNVLDLNSLALYRGTQGEKDA